MPGHLPAPQAGSLALEGYVLYGNNIRSDIVWFIYRDIFYGRDVLLERLQRRNNHNILCMEWVGGKVKRDAKIFAVTCGKWVIALLG